MGYSVFQISLQGWLCITCVVDTETKTLALNSKSNDIVLTNVCFYCFFIGLEQKNDDHEKTKKYMEQFNLKDSIGK